MWAWVLFKQPLFKEPPSQPLPPHELAGAYFGEVWLKYPQSDKPWLVHHGSLFKAWAELYLIANAINCHKWFDAPGSEKPIKNDSASFQAKLSDWYRKLPWPLQAKNICFPAQLQIQ